MKYKSKPIARAEIRERVERKFRARGAVIFHGFASLLGTAVFLWNLPVYWENRFVNWNMGFRDAILMYGILLMTFTLHIIHYRFKHGAGFERHEAETDARINRELRHSGREEAEEREALIEMEQDNKLKNRRLLWQHLSLYLGLSTTMILMHWTQVVQFSWNDEYAFLGVMYLVGAWSIGMIAHALRYVFTYGTIGERRQAKIDAEVAREMAALGLRRSASRPGTAWERMRDDSKSIDAVLADDIEGRHSRSRA